MIPGSRRSPGEGNGPWSIHELYGDEIQDFTQAELALLMKCINDPNAMFLTGDTAQSIMKGVAFRFSDLRSLFHYASRNAVDKQCAVRKPKKIHQLYQNYRSHSGMSRPWACLMGEVLGTDLGLVLKL